VLERLADEAARALGLDRAEIRRRNLVPVEAMPYTTPIGPTYDCGNFPKVFSRLLEIADYKGFAKRQAAAARTRRLRGFGIACYVESSGVAPSRMAAALGARVGFFEVAQIRVQQDGSVQALLGTHNHGQGHATTFAQIISSRLGVPIASVEIIEGDTDQVPYGSGTFGSRSMAVGGSALDRAAMKVIEKGKRIAAHLLEASAGDIAFGEGLFTVAGTDRRVTFREVARVAHHPTNYPADLELGLQDSAVYDPGNFAWSNGVHACELEVDCETGEIHILGYWGVDDIGTVINPMIVEGQIHGGIAQGLGQALREHCFYEADTGQLVSGSFMDYAVPRASGMPDIISELDESQPCTHNPLGAKGCGEAGSIGAPTAIVGAVLDALRPLGVTDIEMPLTAERVWMAIQFATAQDRTRAR
jgi:carbon-monoxide dehydrogenase large subunit